MVNGLRLLLFIGILSARVCAQPVADSIRLVPAFRVPGYTTDRDLKSTEPVVDVNKWVDETAKDISKVRPGSFTPNLSADREAIRSVYKSLKSSRTELAKSDVLALKAVFSAWVDLAVKGYDKTGKEVDYTEADLLDRAMKMAQVQIQTVPDGATIRIDRYDGYGKSNGDVWVTGAGRHLVELVKEGYQPVKEIIEIKLVEPVTLVRTLQPIK